MAQNKDSLKGTGLGRGAREVDPCYLPGTPEELGNRNDVRHDRPGDARSAFRQIRPEDGKPSLQTLGTPARGPRQKYDKRHGLT